MGFAFPWPLSQGEWLAWGVAALTAFLGLVFLFAPKIAFRVLRIQARPDRPEALAESRATLAGFYLGLGLCAILLAQPLIYMTLGVCWALSAFGRLISMLSDGGNRPFNWLLLLVSLVLAALPLAFVFRFVP